MYVICLELPHDAILVQTSYVVKMWICFYTRADQKGELKNLSGTNSYRFR